MADNANAHTSTFKIYLEPDEAWLVAQFLKRATLSDYVSNAVDQDEGYAMMYACEKVRRQLAEQGVAPR